MRARVLPGDCVVHALLHRAERNMSPVKVVAAEAGADADGVPASLAKRA